MDYTELYTAIAILESLSDTEDYDEWSDAFGKTIAAQCKILQNGGVIPDDVHKRIMAATRTAYSNAKKRAEGYI